LNIPVSIVIPLLLTAAFFIGVARFTVYRQHYKLPQVIQFVRKLDVVELSDLFNADEEWALRNVSDPREFRKIQRERIRLAFEYLQRLGHNADVIQSWAVDLYEEIGNKKAKDFTLQDRLICELVEISTDLRLYNIVATAKVAAWVVFRMHLLPISRVPRIADLRVLGDMDVVKTYQSLIETTASLSETFGENYSRQILSALS
jgi:hypothetical protein